MGNLIHADIFFFISAIGFILIGLLIIVLLIKIIQISHTFHKIIKKVEKDIETIGDTTKEMIEEIHDSSLFRLLFNGRKKKTKKVKED